jgi:DNA-binding NarL/FixJ family response regulator
VSFGPTRMTNKMIARRPPPARVRRLGVVLADPLPVVRAGLGMLIEGRMDLEVVAEAGSAEQTLDALARVRHTDVILVGLGLEPPHDAYWLIRAIRERFPAIAILACGARADAMTISRALFVGADGYVDKNVDPPEFLRALREAATGDMVLAGPPQTLVGAIAEGLERRSETATRLTEREREVLTVAAEGLTARQMASRLGVQERTVTTHLGRIYEKLGVGTRVAALRVAASSGLVTMAAGE